MINGNYEIHKRFPKFLTKAITLSYDDGRNFDRKMVEILNKYGIKCTFNLNSKRIEDSENHVNADEIKSLYIGHEVACHTVSHPHLQNLDAAGIALEVLGDRKNLEDLVGRIVKGFAYPFGLCETPAMVDTIAACGIKYARTTRSTHNFDLQYDLLRFNPTCHQADPKLPELAERFFEPDNMAYPWRIKPRLFYIWGHSYEYENNWEKLEDMCRLLAGHDDVWYATNIEIFDYISAFDRLERSADGKYIYNPTDKTLYAVICGKELVIEAGKEYTVG